MGLVILFVILLILAINSQKIINSIKRIVKEKEDEIDRMLEEDAKRIAMYRAAAKAEEDKAKKERQEKFRIMDRAREQAAMRVNAEGETYMKKYGDYTMPPPMSSGVASTSNMHPYFSNSVVQVVHPSVEYDLMVDFERTEDD